MRSEFSIQTVKGIIPLEVEHDVEPLDDDTEFYIEFFRGSRAVRARIASY